jgi:hypothetical protein
VISLFFSLIFFASYIIKPSDASSLEDEDPMNNLNVSWALLNKVSEFESYCLSLEVQHPLAYLRTDAGLDIVDISNPKRPILVITYEQVELLAVHPSKPVIFIAEEEEASTSIAIYNASNPSNFVLLSSYHLSSEDATSLSYRSIHCTENYFYIKSRNRVNLIDISNLTQPIKLGSWSTLEDIYGLAVNNSLVYIKTLAKLLIISFEDPQIPQKISEIDHSAFGWMPGMDFDEGIIGLVSYHSFDLFNITNPYQPAFISEYTIPEADRGGETDGYFFYGISLKGKMACVFGAGLYLMDITNPENPNYLAKYSRRHTGLISTVILSGNKLYLDGEYDLLILNLVRNFWLYLGGSLIGGLVIITIVVLVIIRKRKKE